MRILINDDEQAVLDAYRHILGSEPADQASELDALANALFNEPSITRPHAPTAAITYAGQAFPFRLSALSFGALGRNALHPHAKP